MGCLPTYKNKIYNSLDEIRIVISKEKSLKGKPIVYYKELGEPSHANALDYLINEYDWDNQNATVSQNQNQPVIKVEIFNGFWTREEVAKQTDKVFLFGDNTDDRLNTNYIPSSTQAVIRGLPNAIGIDTKNDRDVRPYSYLEDDDFPKFKQQVDEAIQKAKDSGKIIVIPSEGIGTGNDMLKKQAPKLFKYLQDELNNLKNQNTNVSFEVATLAKVPIAEKIKAPFKSKNSVGFIGFGKTGSSTAYYAEQYTSNNKPVNPDTYISGQVYFASVNGDGTNRSETLKQIIKALDSGANVLLDSKSYIDRDIKGYNQKGEGWIHTELLKLGYKQQVVSNGNVIMWAGLKAKTSPTQEIEKETINRDNKYKFKATNQLFKDISYYSNGFTGKYTDKYFIFGDTSLEENSIGKNYPFLLIKINNTDKNSLLEEQSMLVNNKNDITVINDINEIKRIIDSIRSNRFLDHVYSNADFGSFSMKDANDKIVRIINNKIPDTISKNDLGSIIKEPNNKSDNSKSKINKILGSDNDNDPILC
jgi:hypothetical protein